MRNSKQKSTDLTIKKKAIYKLTNEEQEKVYGGGATGGGVPTTVARTSYHGK